MENTWKNRNGRWSMEAINENREPHKISYQSQWRHIRHRLSDACHWIAVHNYLAPPTPGTEDRIARICKHSNMIHCLSMNSFSDRRYGDYNFQHNCKKNVTHWCWIINRDYSHSRCVWYSECISGGGGLLHTYFA